MIEELYINDSFIELGEASKIGVTFQVNDIANLSNRQGFFSNEFTVPKTKNNQIALEFCSGVNSSSRVPYVKNTVRYFQNGINIVPNGNAIVTSYEGFYKIQVTSGNVNVFDKISDRLITELDFGQLYTLGCVLLEISNIVALNAMPNGIVFPIINFNGASETLRQIDVKRLQPAVLASKILDTIITDIGYTYSGDFLTEDFENLLIPCDTDFAFVIAFPSSAPSNSSTKILAVNATPDTSSMEYVNSETLVTESWDIGNHWTYGFLVTPAIGYRFTASIAGWNQFIFSLNYTRTGTQNIYLQFVKIVNIDGVDTITKLAGDYVISTASPSVVGSTFYRFLNAGDRVAVFVKALNSTDTITFTGGNLEITIYGTDGTHCDFLDANYNTFPVALNLPKIKQTDFIKIICQLYCLSFQTNSFTKNIAFNSFSKIVANIPIALDWSDLFDISQPFSIEYTIGNYAQSNTFSYKVDESVQGGSLVQTGVIYVNNETLPLSQKVVELPFAETEMTLMLDGLDVPYINKYDVVTDTFSLRTVPRILYLDKQTLVSPLLYLDGLGTTSSETVDIPLCYFVLPNRTNLGFADNLLKNNYSEIQNVLIDVKKITCFLKLNATHISDLDFSIPIFLDVQTPKMQINGNFYLNKVGNYTSGKLTQCELVRL